MQAGTCQVRLAARAGHAPMPEQSAVSRRRLSFFAQLKRPVQVLHNPISCLSCNSSSFTVHSQRVLIMCIRKMALMALISQPAIMQCL